MRTECHKSEAGVNRAAVEQLLPGGIGLSVFVGEVPSPREASFLRGEGTVVCLLQTLYLSGLVARQTDPAHN